MTSPGSIVDLIEKEQVRTVEFRFTDLRGRLRHLDLAASAVTPALLENGVMFDGSAVAGWRDVTHSDMLLKPDLTTAVLDPFAAQPRLLLITEVAEPATGLSYQRCPRGVARAAEAHLARVGFGDTPWIAPQAEFHVFDDVRFEVSPREVRAVLDSESAPENAATRYEVGNRGHRPMSGGGALVAAPVDQFADLRAEMAAMLEQLGLEPVVHQHDIGPAQNRIAVGFAPLLAAADRMQLIKYTVHSVAGSYGKSATFMPKPVAYEAGSGMQVQIKLTGANGPLFAGQGYADLSDTCLHFIGGILHHAQALNAFTNPTTNSYRRLAPGEGAPRQLAFAAFNRSAAVRLPFAANPDDKRVEVRFPDPAANPYLAFAALLMAGIDGMARQLDPGEAMDRNLYDLPIEEQDELPQAARSLEEALEALDRSRPFLTDGEVFTDDLIDAYIGLKRHEVEELARTPHPVEFALYYSS